MSTNTTKRGIDLAFLIFMLFDASVGIAAMLKGQAPMQIKKTFDRVWKAMRALQHDIARASRSLEDEKNLEHGEVEENISDVAEFFILCAEAKLNADRTGKTAQLVAIINTFRENIKE